jgi:hypothetical protein
MTEYITRAQLEKINDAIPDIHGLNHLVVLCNAAIQHYLQSLEPVKGDQRIWNVVYVGSSDWDLEGPVTKEDWELAARAPQLLKELSELQSAHAAQ